MTPHAQRRFCWAVACVVAAAAALAIALWTGRSLSQRRVPPLFSRENLVAWNIVPFDSTGRSPEDRAAMLERLGFKSFAYDWRADNKRSFDEELRTLKRHGIKLQAF